MPTESEQRPWWSGQHQELSREPPPDKENADQVCGCVEPLQATGALHRVGRPHLWGVFCAGTNVKTSSFKFSSIPLMWCPAGACVRLADGWGEEAGAAGGDASVWQEHLQHTQVSALLHWLLHHWHVWRLGWYVSHFLLLFLSFCSELLLWLRGFD